MVDEKICPQNGYHQFDSKEKAEDASKNARKRARKNGDDYKATRLSTHWECKFCKKWHRKETDIKYHQGVITLEKYKERALNAD